MWQKQLCSTSVKLPRLFCTQAKRKLVVPNVRTEESQPRNHGVAHSGLYYSVAPAVCKTLFEHGGLPLSFTKQTKTFAETCLMVREPALQIMDLMKMTDHTKPVNRFVMYGEKGVGKSLTLAHLLHYASDEGYLIVHIPWVSEWLRRVNRYKEMVDSSTTEGNVDLPLDAAAWLVHFKAQNNKLLKELDLKVTKEYVWSKREVTEAGSTIIQLIDHGVNRIKYASEVIVALADEIKILSTQNKCKSFVAIDGFNSFFYPLTRLSTKTKKKVPPECVTMTRPFMELTKNDWCNGTVVVTVDQIAVPEDGQESHFPRYLLGKQGFEHMDPFIPVEVKNYSEKEALACMAYYRDRLWLRAHEEAEPELMFLSARNPFRLMEICGPL